MTTELTILYSWRLQAHEIRRNMRNLAAGIDPSRQNSDAKNKEAVGEREPLEIATKTRKWRR